MSKNHESVDIVNIRGTKSHTPGTSLEEEILRCLIDNQSINTVHEEGLPDVQWTKSLPTIVLYEGQGIELYDRITKDRQYYLYRDELSTIQQYGAEIARALVGNEVASVHLTVVDLGAGRMDKAACLLKHLAGLAMEPVNESKSTKLSATYCAIDIQYRELSQRLSDLLEKTNVFLNGRHQSTARTGKIAIRGICGSYLESLSLLRNDGLVKDTQIFVSESCETIQRKCLLWLGSSITNMHPLDATKFLSKFVTDDVLNPGDTFLIGLDHCRDVMKVKSAYSENLECWKAYIRNGVKSAGMILGGGAVSQLDGSSDWEYVARWNAVDGKHMRFVQSRKSLSFDVCLNSRHPAEAPAHVDIKEGEHVFISQSYKYAATDIEQCFRSVKLEILKEWSNNENDCTLYLLQR